MIIPLPLDRPTTSTDILLKNTLFGIAHGICLALNSCLATLLLIKEKYKTKPLYIEVKAILIKLELGPNN